MLNKANIFNIPANYHFFESLASWMLDIFGDDVSKTKVFLPNRRSCRELKKILLQKESLSFLPQIKAISDIGYEDFFDFLPDEEAQNIINELLEIKVLSKQEAVFLLSQEIQQNGVFGQGLKLSQVLKIADNIFDLFEELERESTDLAKLDDIDDSNLAKHKLITLEFLQEFYVGIKNNLLRHNRFFPQAAQNLILSKFSYLLMKNGSKTPIIIAGSTGSIVTSRNLIKAISQDNFVVLYGFEGEENLEENHPQFFLSELVKLIGVPYKNIKTVALERFCLSLDERRKVVNLTMLPSQRTVSWQSLKVFDENEILSKDFKQNFTLINARDEIEEAQIIAEIAKENSVAQKTTAIISNNNKIADLVVLGLEKQEVNFNDSRSFSLLKSDLISFLLQIAELEESDFDSYNLLALLKNPFCKFSQNQNLIAEFEINILRQDRTKKGLAGILQKVSNNQNMHDFITDFVSCFQQTHNINIGQKIKSLIVTAEKISDKNWHQLLENEVAQIEIFEFFEFLKNQNHELQNDNFVKLLKNLFSLVTFSIRTDSEALVQILQNVEARLMNFDTVIISSLNEGDFPQNEVDNWLGKKIRKDLGIDKYYKKIGQNAYDFCNYLANSSVVMTRCKTSNNVELIESPFLTRLRILCQKTNLIFDDGKKYFDLLNWASITKIKAIIPNPKPKLELRPKRISITDISKLFQNPYEIYAKKILRLEKLKEIDYQTSYAEFGSFVHKVLEEYINDAEIQNFEEIFSRYFLSEEAKIIWLPKFHNIFAEFLRENQAFEGLKSFCEVVAQMNFADVVISGKIDRITIDKDSKAIILDYKTGQIPTTKSVKQGINPQLTIAALIISEGLIENIKANQISALQYWKLSAFGKSKINEISSDEKEIELLIAAAKTGLHKIITHFADENNGYVANNFDERSDYKILARFEQWGNEDS